MSFAKDLASHLSDLRAAAARGQYVRIASGDLRVIAKLLEALASRIDSDAEAQAALAAKLAAAESLLLSKADLIVIAEAEIARLKAALDEATRRNFRSGRGQACR